MDKEIVKKNIPSYFVKFFLRIVNFKKLFQDHVYDFKRFAKYSATFSLNDSRKLEGKIIAHYHVIEKGLSYRDIRFGFGQDVLRGLMKLLQEYSQKKYDTSNTQYITAISVINQYIKLHEDNNFEIDNIKNIFETINAKSSQKMGGHITLSREELFKRNKIDFKQFSLSRHSIRDFTNEDVQISLIEEAVEIAQKSPSVCNRQTSRVHVVTDKEKIKKHLSYQNGNRGFGHKINKLLIVTSDLNFFEGSYERNQSFIDAGIYSMSLLNAIHHLELGAITLNWCVNKKRDQEYRKFSKIPESENIIVMIGVGHIPKTVTVPKSERKPVNEVMKFI